VERASTNPGHISKLFSKLFLFLTKNALKEQSSIRKWYHIFESPGIFGFLITLYKCRLKKAVLTNEVIPGRQTQVIWYNVVLLKGVVFIRRLC
jgi:hypothetical protein